MTAESVVQLVLAGGETSVAALLFQSIVNRSKNKVDVQVAVNAMAKEWLEAANARLKESEDKSAAATSEVTELRAEVFDLRDLVGDMLDNLEGNPNAERWHARFAKIGT